jgi:hypothetical protein
MLFSISLLNLSASSVPSVVKNAFKGGEHVHR